MSKLNKLPYEQFLKSFKFVPRIAICLLFKDSKGRLILSRRTIPPLKGYWHLPGSFLLKGEELLDCIKRVAMEELNINIEEASAKLLGVFENLDKDPRGHVIDIVYECQINNLSRLKLISKNIKFFKELPENIGFGHEKIILFAHKKNI